MMTNETMMTTQELERIGESLYGKWGWQTELSRNLGVDGSTVRRWKSGKLPILPKTAEQIRNLQKLKDQQSEISSLHTLSIYQKILQVIAFFCNRDHQKYPKFLFEVESETLILRVKIQFQPYEKSHLVEIYPNDHMKAIEQIAYLENLLKSSEDNF